jgi:hypothetical protein
MKSKLLIAAILFPLFMTGQVINHFDQTDSRWSVARTFPAGTPQAPNFVSTTTLIYGIDGNIFLNGNSWMRLYVTDDSAFSTNLMFAGLIRNSGNRIFFIDPSGQPYTLYDFNLQVGDSVPYRFGTTTVYLPLLSIDSVQIDQAYYRTFHFGEPTGLNAFTQLNEVWIEGIGSVHGPTFPLSPVVFSTEIPDSLELVCSFSAGHQIWQHPDYASCYVNIVMGVEDAEQSSFSLYPNPAQDRLMIDLTSVTDASRYLKLLLLRDSRGAVVKQICVNGHQRIVSIDVSDLAAGMYYSELQSEGGDRIIRKFALVR